MTSLISALSWIPRGAASQNPQKYKVDEQELERIGKLAQGQLEGAKVELELARLMEDGENNDGEEGGEWEECVFFFDSLSLLDLGRWETDKEGLLRIVRIVIMRRRCRLKEREKR